MTTRLPCAYCGDTYRTPNGLKWHELHMHPAAVHGLTTPDELAPMPKGERYRYEQTLCAAVLNPCRGCGKPTADAEQECAKCRHQGHTGKRHSSDPANAAYEQSKRDAMRNLKPQSMAEYQKGRAA